MSDPSQRGVAVAAKLLAIACASIALACRTAAPAAPAPIRPPVAPRLSKAAPEAVRVMTWNTGDAIFPGADGDRSAEFARVLRALEPDVVCLQEVERGDAAAAELLDSILPLADGKTWEHHGYLGNVILSRSALTRRGSGKVEGAEGRQRGHAIALSGDGTPQALYIFCARFDSGTGVALRESQARLVAGQILRHRETGIPPARTPTVVLGDFGAVAGESSVFVTDLLEGRLGGRRSRRDTGPDWDGNDLLDASPRHNGLGDETWTWRDDTGGSEPAVADRIVYTGSVATPVKSFVLDTPAMPADELAAAGLESGDVPGGGEAGSRGHLPVVADFLGAADAAARGWGRTLVFSNGFESGAPCFRWSGWAHAGCGPGASLDYLEKKATRPAVPAKKSGKPRGGD